MAELFPIFLKLTGRRALVVGGGPMALKRVQQLRAAGARVTVVAPTVNAALDDLAESGAIRLQRREFIPADITPQYFLVLAATPHPAANAAVAEEAERQGLLYNAVDDLKHSNFYTPAVVERGDLKIAISTHGHSPVLARRLRQELEKAIPESAGEWVKSLGELRRKLKFEIPVDMEVRRRIMEEVIARTIQK